MNFGRVVRMAIRYKFTFAATIFSALMVAVLWGGIIGAVYPVVEVVFKNKSMNAWIDEKITETEKTVAAKSAERDQLQKELAAAEQKGDESLAGQIQPKIHDAEYELTKAESSLWGAKKAQPWIDAYLPDDPFQTLLFITVFLFVGTVVKDFFLVANNVLTARLSQLATFDLRKMFYRRTLRMDLATFGEDGTADLMSRFTNDVNQVAKGLDSLFGKLIREPLKMIACLAGAAYFSWRLLLLTLFITPVAAFSIQWLAKMLKRANRRAMEEMAGIYTTLEETFRSIKIVKAFTTESQERKRFHHNNKSYYHKSMRIARYDALTHPMTEVLGIATMSVVMIVAGWLMLSTKPISVLGMSLTSWRIGQSAMLTFFALLAGMADPLRKMSDIFSNLQAGFAASDRIFARLDRQPTVRDPKQPAPFQRHHRELSFENVGFAYQPDKPVLEEVNLKIAFGETIAIVGPNGCGKSTLANLIPRFADPTTGVVKVDGVPLADMRLRDVRGQIGLVTQETMLFDDTIFNNIRYGTPHATREQVIEAAKQAHAHRFIEHELPQGYETSAGALGNCLSGGQRQRIALARAILRNPAILILDEATSQVDLESEQAIQQVLEKFTRGRTTILITHRLAVLSLADRIVVMEAGRVLDVGRHDELLARCNLYRRLYQIHFDDLKQTA
jgi:ATP-binding cassette subfamily B protein/subfamily B ATP-binding cassette protein MsbA